MGVLIDSAHLWASAVEVFRRGGAQVVLGDENYIKRREPAQADKLPFVVMVEGLPNLLHELVHYLFAGRADDDHGFDYHQIPYDLERQEHRRVLFEELSCCTISASYLPPAERDPWFREQVEILGVFYGFDDDPMGFFAAVDRVSQIYAQDLQSTLEEGFQAVVRALTSAWPSPCGPPASVMPSFHEDWRRFRAVR